MGKFSVEDLLDGTQGTLLKKVSAQFTSVSTDTRTLKEGEIFFPLKGETFHGHDYISQAIEKGAGAIVTAREISDTTVTVVRVQDTLDALQKFGHYWRKKHKAKIIGITGSGGKTTTKFFLKSLLAHRKTFASEKSFNNHFGVPLTLLQIDTDTDYCIVEMGTNHPGEMASLTQIAEPDISVVTLVGEAHIGMFGSKDLIGREKQDIYKHPEKKPFAIFNLDNDWTQKMYLDWKNPTQALTFSGKHKADVSLRVKSESLDSMTIEGTIKDHPGQAIVQFTGQHNVNNLMAAAACALACGVPPQEIWQYIPSCRTTWGRNQIVQLKSGAKLVFDAYNANPDSMKALVEMAVTIRTDGKRILILGDMAELGDFTIIRHEELGRIAGKSCFDVIWFMGENYSHFERGIHASGFLKKLIVSSGYEESLASSINSMLQPNDIVFVKGSRAAKLERVVPHLNPIGWTDK